MIFLERRYGLDDANSRHDFAFLTLVTNTDRLPVTSLELAIPLLKKSELSGWLHTASTCRLIGLYRENTIAIESEASDSNGDNVY